MLSTKHFGAPVQFTDLKNHPDGEFAKLAGAAMIEVISKMTEGAEATVVKVKII